MLQYFSQGKGVQAARYTPQDFLFRWKKLERIVEREGVEGLLLVCGLDGGDHPCTSFLFNWLFLGLSGQQVYNNRFLDPRFSELIVLLSPKDSFVFLPPDAAPELEGLVYTLQNCTVFAPTEKEFGNRDQFEILKIAAFYRAVSRVSKVGFFLGAEEEAKAVERWPIVQSWALEPVGRTFFTLRFPTVNLHGKIAPLFRNFDKHSLRELAERNAYALEGQIRGSTQCIEYTPLEKRQDVSEAQLQEPLFEAADITGQGTTQRPVRVLLGTRTASAEEKSSKEATVGSSGAFHMIVEHLDPLTQLQVWRTYFLEGNLSEEWQVGLAEEAAQDSFLVTKKHVITRKPNPHFQTRTLILNAYLALVQAVLDGIATVSRDYRNLTREFLQGHVAGRLGALGVVVGKEQVEVALESFDSFGEARAIDFKDSVTFKLTSTFYVFKCRLHGLLHPATQQPLGALAFSESFLLQEGCYLLLTKDTPYFDFWRTAPADYSLLDKLNPNIPFEQLGRAVSTDFRGRLFIPLEKLSSAHVNLPILNVKFYFHERGLRFYHEKFGWQLVLYADVLSAAMVNKISGQWVLFQTRGPLLFEGLEGNTLALEFRGKAFEQLRRKVNDKADPLALAFLDVVPGVLGENWYFVQQVMKREVREGAVVHQHQILQREFLWAFIEAKQLMVLNQMKDIKLAAFRALYQQRIDRKPEEIPPSPTSKQSILVINGTYATAKLKLAQTLAKFGPTAFKYSIFHIPAENLYAKMEVATFLQMLREFVDDLESSGSNLVLVVVPSWINCAEALPQLAEQYQLRSVVAKINAGNFASAHGELTENALTFAVPGWAQTVVVDSQGEREGVLGAITRVVRGFARESRVTRASNSVLSTGQCADIINDVSFSGEYQKFLRSKYGALYRFDQLSRLGLHFLPFRLPLLDLPALRALHEQEGFLVDLPALQKELEPLRVEAENSKDELMEGLFRLQQVMAVQRKREKAPQLRSLRGVAQLQNDERAELLWANGVFRERVVPTSGQTLGFCVLARNYDEFQLKEFLLSLTYRGFILQALKPHLPPTALTEDQRLAISRAGKEKYLEGGEFYDGYFYRDAEGHVLPEHPQLPRLVEEWLAEQNREIEAGNAAVRAEWERYRAQFEA